MLAMDAPDAELRRRAAEALAALLAHCRARAADALDREAQRLAQAAWELRQ